VGTFEDKPLVAGQQLGRLHATLDTATTFARGARRPAAVIEEGEGWAVYELRVRGRFTQRSTEAVPGTGVADVTSVEPVACFVTSDGCRLRAPGPGGHDLSHRQSGPRDDEGELPFEDWTEATGPGMAELDGADFLAAFEVAMRDVALFALATSERRARRTLGQVERGFGVTGGYSVEELARLRLAAGRIEAIDDELDELRETWEPHPDLDNAELLFEEGQTGAPAIDARVPGLLAERDDALAFAPWLRRLPDLTDLLCRSDDEVLAWLGGDCAQILEDIALTRGNLLRGTLRLWSVEPIVTSTAAGLGVSDPEKTALLAQRVRRARRSEALTSIGLAALSIGLALAVPVAGSLGASAGVVAALAVGAAGVGVLDAAAATDHYLERRAAANTDIDPEAALIPDDLAGEWALLALAWVGVALDVADVVYAVRLIRTGHATVGEAIEELAQASSRSPDELEDAARARGFDPGEAAEVAAARSSSAARELAAQADNYDALLSNVIGKPPPRVPPEGYRYHWSTKTNPEEPPRLVAIVREEADDAHFARLTVHADGKVAFGRAGRPKIDRKAAYVLGDDGRPVKLDTFGAELEDEVAGPLLETRRRGLAERDRRRAAGDAEGAGKAAARANRATEELGVEGGKRYMDARDPGAELLFEGRGPGTFDLVYKMSKPPPDFVVVEAKGGSARASSSRRIGDLQVQQGRPEYAEDVLEAMASGGRIDEDIATAIQLALVRSRTEYVEVKQSIRRDGALGRLTARQFDLDLED